MREPLTVDEIPEDFRRTLAIGIISIDDLPSRPRKLARSAEAAGDRARAVRTDLEVARRRKVGVANVGDSDRTRNVMGRVKVEETEFDLYIATGDVIRFHGCWLGGSFSWATARRRDGTLRFVVSGSPGHPATQAETWALHGADEFAEAEHGLMSSREAALLIVSTLGGKLISHHADGVTLCPMPISAQRLADHIHDMHPGAGVSLSEHARLHSSGKCDHVHSPRPLGS